jgi:hypothetical protein
MKLIPISNKEKATMNVQGNIPIQKKIIPEDIIL